MKKLILSIVLLAGCDNSIKPHVFIWAAEVCKPYGGLVEVVRTVGTELVTAFCKDSTRLTKYVRESS